MIGFFCRYSLFDRIKLWRNKIEVRRVKFLVVNEVQRKSFIYEKKNMKLRPGRKKVSDLTSFLDSIVEPGLADRDLPILDLVPN